MFSLQVFMINKLIRLVLNEFSKIDFFKKRSKYLSNWYDTNIKPYPQRLNFLGGHPDRLFKNFKFKFFVWQSAPVHFSGGIILNLLGFHVLRHIFHNTIRKTNSILEDYLQLKNIGVMKVDEILKKEEIAHIRNFYEKNIDKSFIYLPDFSELVIYSNTLSVSNANYEFQEFKELEKFIIKKLNLDKLFENFSGKKLVGHPFMSIIHHKSLIDNNYTAQEDGNNTPHRDVFYPSYKIFIYLNDVSEENAAFVYYPKTHLVKDLSLREVYLKSLRYYLHDKKALKPVNALQYSNNVVAPESQVGAAGTGVIFNVAGIHKRGDYKKDQYRERLVLLIDFRQNDALIIPKEHRWNNSY